MNAYIDFLAGLMAGHSEPVCLLIMGLGVTWPAYALFGAVKLSDYLRRGI